jgi:hypothetical protein
MCARSHAALTHGLLLEGVHALAFSDGDELAHKLRVLASPKLSRVHAVMAARASSHVRQHHSWSARADWLVHTLLTVLRGEHYDQAELVYGTNG